MAIALEGQHRFFPPEAGLDPYLEWARATRFVYYFGRKVALNAKGLPKSALLPVILELHDNFSAPEFFVAVRDRGAEDWLRVPQFYADPPKALRKTRYCTAKVGEQFLQEMCDQSSWVPAYVRRVGLGAPIVRRGGKKSKKSSKKSPKPEGGGSAAKVLVGVIDDAIAFAHERFRLRKTIKDALEHKTRIEYFWCQDGTGTAPWDFDGGSELSKNDIDALLGAYTGPVDEEELYRKTSHVDYSCIGHKPVAWRRAHGTHVMDLAAGFGPDEAKEAASWPIVGVQLPVATTADTSGATLEDYVLEGLDYILARAENDIPGGAKLPIVVNLSYGLLAGPHDGSSILERALDDRIGAYEGRLQIVLPAGNSHLSRCHASHVFGGTNQCKSMHWRIQPEDYTPSHLEIWLPHPQDGALDLELHVTAPDGTVLGPIRKGQTPDIERDGVLIGKVDYASPAPTGIRDRILISLVPTAALDPTQAVAPSGVWLIEATDTNGSGTVHAWIQRDDTPYGYPRGARQSYFDDAGYERFDAKGRLEETDRPGASYVTRASAINAIATGALPVVIGGFRRRDRTIDRHSAGGPVVAPAAGGAGYRTGPDPDAVAVSDDSPGCRGVLAAGSRSGSTLAMGGTSVAAPQVARWIAAELAAGRACGRPEVAAAAVPGLPPGGALQPAPERVGAGRIEWPGIKPRPPITRFEP